MQGFSICSSIGKNTGAVACDPSRGLPIQLIIGSASFAPSDYATLAGFEAAFLNKFIQPAGSSNKLFPLPVIQGNTDKTVAAKMGTLGYGLQIKLLRSKAGYEFDVLAGSALEAKLIAWDGLTVPLFIMDDKSKLWGIMDSALNFKGANYLISVEPKGFEDATNPKTTKIMISIIDSRDFIENAEFASTSFNSADMVGLNDVVLTNISNTTNVWQIGIIINTKDVLNPLNVASTYTSALAVGALWQAFTGATFATSLTITSVAYNSSLKCWTVTFDSTAYTALAASTPIELSLVDSVTLNTANVTGIEGTPLVILKS